MTTMTELTEVYGMWRKRGFSGLFSMAESWAWLLGLGYWPIVNHSTEKDGWYKRVRGSLIYKFSIDDGYALWKNKDKETPF